jgi:putative SOS response-associated peptidase YedK
MCGRYYIEKLDREYIEIMREVDGDAGNIPLFKPRYNIAPQQTAPIIRMKDGKPVLEELRWGFRPAWLKDKNKAQINARGETLFEKPMFKHSAINRRCLVLASGWYEWQKTGSVKQPFAFHLKKSPLVAFAGIWTTWHGEKDEHEDSYAIVTTEANTVAAPIHDRMPVILSQKAYKTWLGTENKDATKLESLLVPYKGKDLNAYPVSSYVNSPKNSGEKCLEKGSKAELRG